MEGSNSDSDSKENSVVESSTQKKCIEDLPELPEVVRLRNDIKKSQFRGFYLTQKTLVADSNSSSMDFDAIKQACSLEAEDEEIIKREPSFDFEVEEELEKKQNKEIKQDVPKIIEDLVNVPEEVIEDDATEKSDVPINFEDKQKIEKDHENPGIDADFKVSVSQVKHSRETESSEHFLEVLNTSDEDISELVSDVHDPAPKVRTNLRLKINLKNLDSSDEEESKEIKTKKKKAQKKGKIKKQSFSSGNETDISDIIVSDMDYYKIRHQSDVQENKEYCLSWSPTRFMTRMKSFDESQVLSIPNIRTCDIPDDIDSDDGKETSDEDFSCLESDFMTMEEFLEAYRTNWDFDKKEAKIKICSKSSIQDDSDSEPEAHNTESLRESLLSDSTSIAEDVIQDLEQDTDSEEMETSVADNPLLQEHSPGCIHFMEHSELEGTAAFLSQPKMKTIKETFNDDFKAENIVFESDDDEDDEVMTEELYEDEKTNVLQLFDNDDTDEENISDFNDDPIHYDEKNQYNCVQNIRLKSEKSISSKKSKICIDYNEKEKSSEDESLENFVMSPTEEGISPFPNTCLNQLDGEISSVKSSQSQKMKSKKMKNLNLQNSKKIEMEEI